MKFYSFLIVFGGLIGCGQVKDSSNTLDDVCSSTSSAMNLIKKVPINKIDDEHLKNGDVFTTDGYMYLNMEDVAIYAKQGGGNTYRFWLNFSDSLNNRLPDLEKLGGKKVSLSGKINFNKHGHLGYYTAEIDSVFCVRII